MYSQNNEEAIILEYFKDKPVGVLLDLGANDGKTFSNSLALIEKGWQADLFEPSPTAYQKLSELHKGRNGVYCYNAAIVPENYMGYSITLHDMGNHVGKDDTSLLATIIESEKARWKGEKFTPVEVYVVRASRVFNRPFNFITIDIEGVEECVLPYINWDALQMLCIEWNSNVVNKLIYEKYIPKEFKLIHQNAENLIYAR